MKMAKKNRKFKLSDKRKKYVKNRDVTLQGKPIRANPRAVEREAYKVEMEVRKMHLDMSSQIEALFKSSTAKQSIEAQEVTTVAMDASISSAARVLTNKLVNKWTETFNTFGKDWTNTMIHGVETQSAKDLEGSMNKLSGGLVIDTNQISPATRDRILASTDQSTSLIKSIGNNYATEVKEAVSRAILDDTSSFTELQNSIHEMLQGKYKKYKNKAKNTAQDQVRKSYTNITTSRMKDIGVDGYIWRHAGGSVKPRDYHRDVLNGNTYSLSDPPVIQESPQVKGKPGDLVHCKCFMVPIVKFG
jgi:uncharacterized protein with gpF-like domain